MKEVSAAAILTVREMAKADAATIAAGTPGIQLMESAGAAVARSVRARWSPRPVSVLCGPGYNGGDGYVVARHLRDAGWPVTVSSAAGRERLHGDAALAAARWIGPDRPLDDSALDGAALVVDGLFGAGLDRPLEGTVRRVVDLINVRGLTCVAIDVPSGVHGETGQVLGTAPQAQCTVTFFRRKPGHVLLPGRSLCGQVAVADIGIPDSVLREIRPAAWENQPCLWLEAFPWPRLTDHKYRRGHSIVIGGAQMTGAARLAARAARRVGAGLVTVGCSPDVVPIYAADRPGLLVTGLPNEAAFEALLADERRNALLIGPGSGADDATRRRVLAGLRAGKRCVVDADALIAFAADRTALFEAVQGPCILTPHEGEFARLFPSLAGMPSKIERARAAAALSGAVLVLKGADTVIAAPDGRAIVNGNAPPDLATAGTGDVLAGLVLGLLAQGMAELDAAAAATWLHGAAAAAFGPGLIAEDVVDMLPATLRRLRALHGTQPT